MLRQSWRRIRLHCWKPLWKAMKMMKEMPVKAPARCDMAVTIRRHPPLEGLRPPRPNETESEIRQRGQRQSRDGKPIPGGASLTKVQSVVLPLLVDTVQMIFNAI